MGITPNQLLNSSFVKRARDDFRVPEGFVAVSRPESGLAPELVQRGEAVVLFDGPHDVERWDVRCRHAAVEVERFVYSAESEAASAEEQAGSEAAARSGDRFVLLSIERGGRVLTMFEKRKLQAGDVAAIAIHVPERADALSALATLGFALAEIEGEAGEEGGEV